MTDIPPKGRVDDLPAAAPQLDAVQPGERSGGGCYGSVLLDNELWHTLSAMSGGEVPWVHGCALDHGHHGDHGAPSSGVDGLTQHWLRWANTEPARLERVELSAPGRHSRSHGAPPPSPQPSQSTQSAAGTQVGEAALPATGSQTEALWAIAAALERLADAVTRISILPHDNGLG